LSETIFSDFERLWVYDWGVIKEHLSLSLLEVDIARMSPVSLWKS
jgi:hypothetical protein